MPVVEEAVPVREGVPVQVEGLSPVLRQMLQAARAAMLLAFLYRECFFWALASGGSIVLIWKGRKAKRRSRQAMKVFAQMGDNWDAKEIQRQVEEAYFQIQECWRRMDISYGAPYLSEELQKEFDSKIQWMVLRNEEVIQKNVRLLRAMPVSVQDERGRNRMLIWYLIHGK